MKIISVQTHIFNNSCYVSIAANDFFSRKASANVTLKQIEYNALSVGLFWNNIYLIKFFFVYLKLSDRRLLKLFNTNRLLK